jgi:sorting nexin-3/12
MNQILSNDPLGQSNINSNSNNKSSPIQIEVSEPQDHAQVGNTKRYTDYLVKTKTTLPIFTAKEFSVRRRFSDFEWLKTKIEELLKIKAPSLPDKGWKRQVPFFQKESLFDEDFVEDRRKALNQFINTLSEHPLVQTEKIWISFLQDDELNKR